MHDYIQLGSMPNFVYMHYAGLGEGAKKKKKKKKPKKKTKATQSDPPRVPLSKIFPNGVYPEGEIQQYKDEYVYIHRNYGVI